MKKNTISANLISALLILFIFVFVSESQAQRQPVRKALREKIEARHTAFITEKVNLTPEEARVFWPVYNEYTAKRKEINKQLQQKKQQTREGLDNLTEQELKELADAEIVFEQRQLDLKKEYHARFKTILSPKKIIQLYEADRQFKKILLKRLQEFRNKG